MILRILGILLAGIIILFIGYWIWTGGLSRAVKLASGISNPFMFLSGTSTGGMLHLPGQPSTFIDTIDISTYENGGADSSTLTEEQRLTMLQNQYNDLSAQAKDPRNFGNPSPYKDQITFGLHTAQENSPEKEYVTLQASFANTAPISLSGWSLQSAVTGLRIALPPAASAFISGVVNTVSGISLSSGSTVYIVSGTSPVGVSFRENICTGYLGELQTFIPDLNKQCPLGSDELPLNAQNISTLGDACIDYVKNLPQCHFPGLDPKPDVTPACMDFLVNRLSYNGCVYAHKIDSNFYSASWRLYLGSGVNLWRDTHDVIRLLDDSGRTVDVLTY